MPGLDFLDSRHEIHQREDAEWAREERRLAGGGEVLSELVQFAAEESDSYAARQAWARWLNFAKVHTSILSGHIRRGMPMPNYAELGKVRPRSDIKGDASLAEVFHYNCDGIGSDGKSLPAFLDGVEQRALATKFRWLMAEMPSKATLRAIRRRLNRAEDAQGVTEEEVRAGFRTFIVERSPRAGTNWKYVDGVLVWIIFRIRIDPKLDFAESGQAAAGLGYYLLVRKGYEGLGPEYAAGGWWKYDAQKGPVDEGTWDDTGGEIPVWQHVGEPGEGTYEHPSVGASSTMELGQISADLMNARSEQRFNLRQAAKSINYWRGIDKISHDAMNSQLGDASINVAVPPALWPDGTYHLPELTNSSEFVLDAQAYELVTTSAVAEAKEVMVRQITAGVDASGVSRETAFGEATSPLLAKIAATAETSINTMLYFVLRRMGIQRPTASIALPTEYKLRDILSDIDGMLEQLQKAGQRSPTWERHLLTRKGDELDLVPEEERKAIEDELGNRGDDLADLARIEAQAKAGKALIEMGASEAGAAKRVGMTPEEVRELFSTPTPENPDTPDIQPVPVPPAVPPVPPVEQPVPTPAAA